MSTSFTQWKTEKFIATQFFRQINLEWSSLLKKLLSRNFCNIIVSVSFWILLSWIFSKTFVKSKPSLDYNIWIHEISFKSVKIKETYSHIFLAKIPWKQRFYLRNNHWRVDLTKYFFSETKLFIFPQFTFTQHIFSKNFVKIMFLLFKEVTKELI